MFEDDADTYKRYVSKGYVKDVLKFAFRKLVKDIKVYVYLAYVVVIGMILNLKLVEIYLRGYKFSVIITRVVHCYFIMMESFIVYSI